VKTTIAILIFLAASAALLLVPHHARDQGTSLFKRRSLFENLREMTGAFGDLQSPRAFAFAVVTIASVLLLPVWPVALVLLLRFAHDGDSAVTPVLLIGGVSSILAAAVNFLVMFVSQLSIGFGGGSSTSRPTAVLWLAPFLQAVIGVASVVAAISPPFADTLQAVLR
jgi:hypothetical protein